MKSEIVVCLIVVQTSLFQQSVRIAVALRLLLAENQVNHPAAADVWSAGTTMGENRGIVTPAFFQGIAQNWQVGKALFFVDDPSDGADCGGAAGGGKRDGSERVAEDVAQQIALRA